MSVALDGFDLAHLHDATLLGVAVDWPGRIASVACLLREADLESRIPMQGHFGAPPATERPTGTLRFELRRLSHVTMPIDESWGPSDYILAVGIARSEESELVIEMQSGDVLRLGFGAISAAFD